MKSICVGESSSLNVVRLFIVLGTLLVLIMPAMKLNLSGLRWMSAWVLTQVSGIQAQCQRLSKIIC